MTITERVARKICEQKCGHKVAGRPDVCVAKEFPHENIPCQADKNFLILAGHWALAEDIIDIVKTESFVVEELE